VGIESRVFVPEFSDREINSPGEPGISYHMGTGFTTTEIPEKAQVFLDNMTLSGRYDIQYFNKGKKTICDFKTSTNIPSKKSVLNGEHLQLPMYSLLNPNVEIFEYYFINVSQKITKRITFEKDEFINSTDIILDTIERINFDLKNKTKYYLTSSYNGCANCGFQVTREK